MHGEEHVRFLLVFDLTLEFAWSKIDETLLNFFKFNPVMVYPKKIDLQSPALQVVLSLQIGLKSSKPQQM